MIFDSHIHLCHCDFPELENWQCISSFCTKEEWESFKNPNEKILKSFGIHPQIFAKFPKEKAESDFAFLEELLKNEELFAIGEIGFDFFTDEFKKTKTEQIEFWKKQISLAILYKKPCVIHIRKAIDMIFKDSALLKKLPAVIFHSFPGNAKDAESILSRGINAFFSLGKHQIFNGKKATLDFLNSRDNFENRILLETDAPYQTLKGEKSTKPEEIFSVYKKLDSILGAPFEEKINSAVKKLFADCKISADFF